jgi:hypothetical protein
MRRYILFLTNSGAALMVALAASAGPEKLWTGSGDGTSVSLSIEGQKVRGKAMTLLPTTSLNTPNRVVELELAGSGSKARYQGTLKGTLRIDGPPHPVTGRWSATVGEDGVFTFVCGSDASAEIRRIVPLLPGTEGTLPQRVAWWQGSLLRKPDKSVEYYRASENNPIILGDTFETGPNSSAVMIFADRGVLVMHERTRVIIPNVPENRKMVQKVAVVSGSVWTIVRKKQQNTGFWVQTDHVTASTLRAEFCLVLARNGGIAITAADGEVTISDRRKRTTTHVKAGTAWRSRPAATVPSPNPAKVDVKPVAQRWKVLLSQVDRLWQYRRKGKTAIWQDRYFKPVSPSRLLTGFRR